MFKKLTTVFGICILSAMVAVQAPADDGVGEKIGKKIDRSVNSIISGVQKEWAQMRQSIEKMGVQARVYGRLHWDKALESATLDIETREGHVIVLKGRVADLEAKQKAVQLASDTVGVSGVVDELSIAPRTN